MQQHRIHSLVIVKLQACKDIVMGLQKGRKNLNRRPVRSGSQQERERERDIVPGADEAEQTYQLPGFEVCQHLLYCLPPVVIHVHLGKGLQVWSKFCDKCQMRDLLAIR